ncbi:LysR family transcriptional regulator [Paracoccus sp. (in: a-proteobacteria)]|uniref:LysR family transcriptional regulator n=1 Tax=Paracoccus sp. TaxID=267 RepID=UPI0028971AF7|nr:LysR family transcriptional regulator [Paracoccus sp. (in: a-proteobacteria)]
MELKWLEDFVMLASTASFSRAAEARHITQSAFSRRIKQLEGWLGTALISRASIPAELTGEGKAFLPVAQEAIRVFYATRDHLRPPNGRQKVLNLAALHTLSVTMLPDCLARIETHMPEAVTRVIPDKGGIEANLEALVSGEADLFLTYAHPYVPMLLDPEHFNWITLGREAVVPVVSPNLLPAEDLQGAEGCDLLDHALKQKRELPYLDYGLSSFFGTALQRLLTERPFRRRVVHENSISVGLKELALRGKGLCWLPKSLIQDELTQGALIQASSAPAWQLDVEIRLYSYRSEDRAGMQSYWDKIVAAFQDESSSLIRA